MFKNKRPNSRSLYFSDRLTEVLSQIPQFPLTVMEAPMGYGKTTAIQEYSAKTGITALWETVRENDEAHFWHDFCEVFAELDPDCSRKLAELGLPVDGAARREAVALIANRHGKDRALFVIDDYHLLTDPDVHEFIVSLVRRKIPGFHVVIATRMVSLEMLEELKNRGKNIAVVSNKFYAATQEICRHFFGDLVDVAIGERENIKKKPAPDTVNEALRQLHANRDRAVYIGDSDVDVMTAKNSGMPCISVLWGFRDHDFLLAHGASILVSSPLQIL